METFFFHQDIIIIRELLDDTDRNEDGKRRYEINCMYEVKLQNGEIINAYEDEINPNYCGDYEA